MAGGGDGGWMCWSVVLRIVGLRFEKERDRGERETYRERGRIKNDKEKIFK